MTDFLRFICYYVLLKPGYYSSTVLENKFEALELFLSVSILCNFNTSEFSDKTRD